MSARVARRPWSKSRSSAIWRTTPEHTATAAGGAGASRPSDGMRIWSGGRSRPRSTARMISAARPWARCRPSMPRVPRSSSALRGGRCDRASSPRSDSTMRRGRLVSAAVRSRHAATSCATARERRDMPRMSPSFHHASSGTRAGARSPSTWSHSLEGPLQPAQRPQPLGEHVPQLQQVGDVVEGVGDLAVRDGPDEPVREPVRLRQRDAEHLVHQAGQRRRGETEEAGDDLGVEDRGGHGAARRHQHVEVLGRRVGHRDAGPAEDAWPAARGRPRAGRRAPCCRPRRSGSAPDRARRCARCGTRCRSRRSPGPPPRRPAPRAPRRRPRWSPVRSSSRARAGPGSGALVFTAGEGGSMVRPRCVSMAPSRVAQRRSRPRQLSERAGVVSEVEASADGARRARFRSLLPGQKGVAVRSRSSERPVFGRRPRVNWGLATTAVQSAGNAWSPPDDLRLCFGPATYR